MASILRARLVKNFAARTNSTTAWSSTSRRSDPSLSDRVRQLYDFVRSSILEVKKKRRRIKKTVSQTPPEEKPQSLEVNLLPRGTKTPSKKRRLFYTLGEDGDPTFTSGEKLWCSNLFQLFFLYVLNTHLKFCVNRILFTIWSISLYFMHNFKL